MLRPFPPPPRPALIIPSERSCLIIALDLVLVIGTCSPIEPRDRRGIATVKRRNEVYLAFLKLQNIRRNSLEFAETRYTGTLTGAFINGTLYRLVYFHGRTSAACVFSVRTRLEILRRPYTRCAPMDTLSLSRGCLSSLLFPSLSPFFLLSFLSFFDNLQKTDKTSRSLARKRKRERESGHELLFRDVPYYNGPPRGEYRASRGEPLEDVFENVGARFSLGA